MTSWVTPDGDTPQVSVVIPVLNAAATIGSVLASLRSQSGAPTFEVIAADNGSTDGTLAILEAAGELVLLHESHRGPAAARNRGWRAARAEIVAFLDADAIPTRRWLAELVRPFSKPATLAVAGHIDSFPPRNAPQRFAQRYGVFERRLDDPSAVGGPSTANMAVRRSVLTELNGFDQGLLTAEDLDFWIRYRGRYGVGPQRQPEAMVLHEHRSTDAALRRQAIGYGYGAGQLYLRYPDLLPWGWRQRRIAAGIVTLHTLGALRTRLGGRLGRRSPEDVEFASYLRRWTWWWWSGFRRGRRTGLT